MNRKAEADIRRKNKVLEFAEVCGNVSLSHAANFAYRETASIDGEYNLQPEALNF